MPCLEPDKKLSDEEKKIILIINRVVSGNKARIAKEGELNLPLVSRKLRKLIEKELVSEQDGAYQLSQKGREAVEALTGKSEA